MSPWTSIVFSSHIIIFFQKLLDVYHSSLVICILLALLWLFYSILRHDTQVNTWILNFEAAVERTWTIQTDRLSSLTFKDATNCHACVVHHSCSPRQRCSALYSTYCQCIIQQFRWVVALWMSLRGQWLMEHHKHLNPGLTVCAYICEGLREWERPAEVKCKHLKISHRGIYSISSRLQFLLYLHQGLCWTTLFPICANKHKNTRLNK